MNAKALLLTLSLVTSTVAALAIAPRASAKSEPAAAWTSGKLDQSMQILQSGQQKLGKALDKKDVATVLAQVVEMQKAAQEAKLDTPPKAGEYKEADKKAAFVNGFRKQMIALQKDLLDLEAAAVDGDLDEAKKIFDERVKAAKKSGHDQYKGN